jgi:phosphoglycerol transferase MdoB-like AlkP superfamily enzyme
MPTNRQDIASLFTTLKPLIFFAFGLISILTISRLLLVAWQWERVTDVDMLAAVFVQGLRFDLVLLGLSLVIPALLFPILAATRWTFPTWRYVLRVYLPVMFVLVLFMELSTPSFINQFDSRPNILFFEYLNHPREVSSTLWAAYKMPIIFALMFLAVSGVTVSKQFRRMTRHLPRPRSLLVLLAAPVLLMLCLGLVRSTFDHRPVNPSTVALSKDPLVNELALSSAYTALYAIYETRHESQGGFRYGQLDDETVIAEIRASMDEPKQEFPYAEAPTLHFQLMPAARIKPRNLVIVVEESLGAEFVGSLGGLDLTPNLDKLADEGLWFDNLYATGTRSVRGLEAIVSGFTPTPARSVVKLPKSQRDFFTLAELLGQAGYETSFIYGGEAQFDNMRRFFMNNGFDRVVDEGDYDHPTFTGSWGVSDEDLFDRAHKEFSANHDRPFFSLVFSSSNHSPYQFPDGRIEPYDDEKNTVNNAVLYADYALGQFFQHARNSDYWEDTVFLVVSDHNSRVYGSELIPVDRFHIPGLILGGSVAPGHFQPVASQIDLAPTLLSMIGVAAEHPMIGHDLTRPDAKTRTGRAIMQYNSTQAYMEGDRIALLQKDLPARQFLYQDEHLIEDNHVDPGLIRKALAHSLWSSMAYERSMFHLH